MAIAIDALHEIRWQEPVWVRVGYGSPEAVRGPNQAITYLTFRWPAARGDGFNDAMERCNLALRKEFKHDAAREAFIRVAQEADMMA